MDFFQGQNGKWNGIEKEYFAIPLLRSFILFVFENSIKMSSLTGFCGLQFVLYKNDRMHCNY